MTGRSLSRGRPSPSCASLQGDAGLWERPRRAGTAARGARGGFSVRAARFQVTGASCRGFQACFTQEGWMLICRILRKITGKSQLLAGFKQKK